MFFHATPTHNKYRDTLSKSCQGISLSEAEVSQLDEIVFPLIRKGQSLNLICVNNKNFLTISVSTLYRLIEYNVFTARNIDLPRKKARYSERKVKKTKIR